MVKKGDTGKNVVLLHLRSKEFQRIHEATGVHSDVSWESGYTSKE